MSLSSSSSSSTLPAAPTNAEANFFVEVAVRETACSACIHRIPAGQLRFFVQYRSIMQFANSANHSDFKMHLHCLILNPVMCKFRTDPEPSSKIVPCQPYLFEDPASQVQGLEEHARVLKLFQKYLQPGNVIQNISIDVDTIDETRAAEEPEYMPIGAAAILLNRHIKTVRDGWCKGNKVEYKMSDESPSRYLINMEAARKHNAILRAAEMTSTTHQPPKCLGEAEAEAAAAATDEPEPGVEADPEPSVKAAKSIAVGSNRKRAVRSQG